MAQFASHEEFYATFNGLLERLTTAGQTDAVACLREGLSWVNGLTDGWAQLLEAVEQVWRASRGWAAEDRADLARLRRTLRRRVWGPGPRSWCWPWP